MWIAAFRAIVMDDELLDVLVFHPLQESVHGVFGLLDGWRLLRRRGAKVERALALDDELFASLQSRAFRGEL